MTYNEYRSWVVVYNNTQTLMKINITLHDLLHDQTGYAAETKQYR